MSSDKLGLTLFDILGYLLPGYILILCGSLIEATFVHSGLLSLSNIRDNWLLYTVAAYFAGHLCHIIASLVKGRFFKHLGQKYRESNPLYERFREALREKYHLQASDKLGSLDFYVLADSYLIASGMSEERNSLMVREGFYKSATAALGLLTLTVGASLFASGLGIQADPGKVTVLTIPTTVVFVAILTLTFILFAGRFAFYNRMKLEHTYTLFLALCEKEQNRP